jgi:hypothetical protein
LPGDVLRVAQPLRRRPFGDLLYHLRGRPGPEDRRLTRLPRHPPAPPPCWW